MASKRALQCLSLRAPSTVALRSQCVSFGCTAPRYFRLAAGVREREGARGKSTVAQAKIAAVQRRLHSRIPDEQRGKIYQFEDIVKIIESPDSTEQLLIDVREPREYNAGAIPTAINIPITSQPDAMLLPEEEFEDRFGFQKPSVTKEVVFYCKAGVRSSAAAQIAKRGGYDRVGEYRGSWLDWQRKGGVDTKNPADTSQRPGKGEPENPVIAEESVKKKYE
ncbi:Rhodanese-like domain-containing protein [Lophiotrema nucula]|uniref:Rhodanese-like domain-containing protein n=1 Tax=Lophiotrema nucula TaxID=690887 RepID=A0A6A5YSA5_9PLEO|nr:Rhodanese-like domain-containing protein [Lophiotrema nucula]